MPRPYPAIVLVVAALCGPATAVAAATTQSCRDAAHHRFDFWLGDWDTFDSGVPGQPSIARNHVEAILGGCVLREDYTQYDGLHGQSFTIYDAPRRLWHQSWVTNRGDLLVLEGRPHGHRIVLEGVDHARQAVRMRVSWEPVADGVREIATRSRDSGRSWQPLFDIVFRKHPASPAGARDAAARTARLVR